MNRFCEQFYILHLLKELHYLNRFNIFEFGLHVNVISWNFWHLLHGWTIWLAHILDFVTLSPIYVFLFFLSFFSVIVHKMISKIMLNMEFVLNLGERMYYMTFEKLRNVGGKINKKKKKRVLNQKKNKKIWEESKVEKYEKKKKFEVYAY